MLRNNILFLTETLTNYQYDFFDKLSNFQNLKVIVCNKNAYKNYDFKFTKRNYLIFLEDYKDIKKKISEVSEVFKPKIIFFCGYRLKLIPYIKKINLKKNIKYFFWLERFNEQNKIKFYLIKKIIKFFLIGADGLFVIGNKAKNFYSSFNKNVFNIPYSIRIPKKKFLKKISKKTKFLFVGQLIRRKGIDILIDCIKKLKDENINNFEILIIGNGEYKYKIRELIKKNNNIKYKSFLNQKNLINEYKQSHVLIFPSRFDGWGVVPMQAMSYSMYVITGNNCGVNEVTGRKNKIIDVNVSNLLGAIKNCCNNKSSIIKQGQHNYYLIRNSICNLDNSIIKFNKVISKF